MTDEELKLLAKKELIAYVKGETFALCPASKEYWKKNIEDTFNCITDLEAEKCELLGIIQGKDEAIEYLKSVIKSLLDNSDEMARQRAMDAVKE